MTANDLILRPVERDDLPAVRAIYDHYVLNTTCTFETEPRDEDSWLDWMVEHEGTHPAIVALRGGDILGWGSLSLWKNRCAYRYTVENSVYVHPEKHREGVGQAVLRRLIELAREHGHRGIIAQIADHQAASEALHQSEGFRRVGCLERVGFKFGRWIDVVIWQLTLDNGDHDRTNSPFPTPQ